MNTYRRYAEQVMNTMVYIMAQAKDESLPLPAEGVIANSLMVIANALLSIDENLQKLVAIEEKKT